MSARFAARRVLPIADQGVPRAERDVVWLLMEWEDGQKAPNKFHFITAPTHVTKKWLVRQVKQRWRTERAYEDMKGQLGLDPLRRASLSRLAASRFHGAVLLCIHRCRAYSAFPPSGPRVASKRCVPPRGLSATSPTPSSPFDEPLRASSPRGCLAARADTVSTTRCAPAPKHRDHRRLRLSTLPNTAVCSISYA